MPGASPIPPVHPRAALAVLRQDHPRRVLREGAGDPSHLRFHGGHDSPRIPRLPSGEAVAPTGGSGRGRRPRHCGLRLGAKQPSRDVGTVHRSPELCTDPSAAGMRGQCTDPHDSRTAGARPVAKAVRRCPRWRAPRASGAGRAMQKPCRYWSFPQTCRKRPAIDNRLTLANDWQLRP